MIAIDANIAVKWYVPEADSPKALSLLKNPAQLIAPSLIRQEVCSALTRRARDKELTAAEAREHCQDWFLDIRQDAVRLVPEEEILQRAIDLSLKIRHPLQDALYLAVAEAHAIPLITADDKFHKRALVHYPQIHLLSQWRKN